MKRASYRAAVKWIAVNDEPTTLDLEAIQGFVTVLLVADLFGKSEEQVATDVQRVREDALNSPEEMPTRFHADQKVVAVDNVQGLVKGETYVVTSANEQQTAFGNFVTYTVEPTKAPIPPMHKKVLFIQNGHLFLKEAA